MAFTAPGGQFISALLSGLGDRNTPQDRAALTAWQRAEGGSAAFNPFNTTEGAGGASNYNSVGVKSYASYGSGLQATLATLRNGHYGAILQALHRGNNAQQVAQAIGSSPWGTSGSLVSSILKGMGVQGGLGSAPTDFAKGKGAIETVAGKTQRFDSALFHRQAGMLMLQSAVAEANGGVDPTTGQPPPDLLTSLVAARHAATQQVSLANAGGGKVAPAIAGGGANSGNSVGARAVAMAKRQLGVPYVWGGETPGKAFDCSGLVQWAYGAVGVKMPRVAVDQGRMGHAVSYGALQPGDLLVENNGDHIVMYAGNGRVIQAPHTGQRVQMSPLSWFPSSQYKARRIR